MQDEAATIQAWIQAWCQGDERAVRAVFETYYPRAVRLAALSGLTLDAANVDQLSISWHVYTVYLMRSGDAHTTTSTAGWTISFNLPFHRTNNGPGGPFVQPTRTQ